jgi:NADH-quinone oxidoreductase subunit M
MILLGILLSPLIGLAAVLTLSGDDGRGARRISILSTLISLVLALYCLSIYGGPGSLDHLTLNLGQWVPSQGIKLGITFHLAMDGLTLVLTLLNAVVLQAACQVSYSVEDRPKEFYVCLLALGAGVFGVFLFQDLFWFFLSYELAVVPMFILIGTWGSTDRERASMTLNLYLTCGAFLALGGLLWVYFAVGGHSGHYTFNLPEILAYLEANPGAISPQQQIMIFPFLFVGFASLAPMWPFHTWSPMGHAAAPSAASMMHAGVLMKLGSFAIIKIALQLAPEGAKFWLPVAAVLACFNIIWGGLVAMAQQDMKFMIGYSSSSHMGYVILGIAALNLTSLTGAVFLMFAHGVMTALAFSTIGFFYDQTHTRMFKDLGGMARQIPFIGTCFAIMAMASAGLPGFANFASELLVLIGLWHSTGSAGGGNVYPYQIHTIVGLWGIVVGSVYLLRAVKDAFQGPRNPRWDKLKDAEGFQRVPFVLLIVTLMITGCYPPLLINPIQDGLVPILSRLF